MAGNAHPDIVTFGAGESGVAADREVHGGKGAGLIELAAAGLPVPPGFILPTNMCSSFVADGWTDAHAAAVRSGIAWLEDVTGRRFGGPGRPLLVSVRSGAPTSMPGMLDSLLDVGIDDDVEAALADESGDPRFAADTRRRFIEGFRSVVGADAPDDVLAQVEAAVAAVFGSHRGARAEAFRRRTEGELQLTAVIVQQMVFGNLGDASGTGVAYSSNPITGEKSVSGEYMGGVQGVDLLAGTARPAPLSDMARRVPAAHAELLGHLSSLAATCGSPVEVEFTVERARLHILQVRRSAPVTDDVRGPMTTVSEQVIEGVAASAGSATGVLVTDLHEALTRSEAGESVVLFRPETTPADVEALAGASGLVTVVGGMVSHAAVIARAWGIPAVVGCDDLEWRADGVVVGDRFVPAGTPVTVDGTAGVVHLAPDAL